MQCSRPCTKLHYEVNKFSTTLDNLLAANSYKDAIAVAVCFLR